MAQKDWLCFPLEIHPICSLNNCQRTCEVSLLNNSPWFHISPRKGFKIICWTVNSTIEKLLSTAAVIKVINLKMSTRKSLKYGKIMMENVNRTFCGVLHSMSQPWKVTSEGCLLVSVKNSVQKIINFFSSFHLKRTFHLRFSTLKTKNRCDRLTERIETKVEEEMFWGRKSQVNATIFVLFWVDGCVLARPHRVSNVSVCGKGNRCYRVDCGRKVWYEC